MYMHKLKRVQEIVFHHIFHHVMLPTKFSILQCYNKFWETLSVIGLCLYQNKLIFLDMLLCTITSKSVQ